MPYDSAFRASLVATVTPRFHTASRTIGILEAPPRTRSGIGATAADCTRSTPGCGATAGAIPRRCVQSSSNHPAVKFVASRTKKSQQLSTFFAWLSACRSKGRQELVMFAASRAAKSSAASFLTTWYAHARELSLFRNKGRRLMVRWVSNHVRRLFQRWAARAAATAAQCRMVGCMFRMRQRGTLCVVLQRLINGWRCRMVARLQLAALFRSQEAYRKKIRKLRFYYGWACKVLKQGFQRFHMDGDLLVFLHFTQMKHTWNCVLSCFQGWKYFAQLKSTKYSDLDETSPLQPAVIMSNIPKLQFQASEDSSADVVSAMQR